jgi:hypothetical protein
LNDSVLDGHALQVCTRIFRLLQVYALFQL